MLKQKEVSRRDDDQDETSRALTDVPCLDPLRASTSDNS